MQRRIWIATPAMRARAPSVARAPASPLPADRVRRPRRVHGRSLRLRKAANARSRPVTLDLDGDGHRSPKPGFAPGAPGACGDDCDDRSASAHPGGIEACDGVDNDCNGKIDDGALYGNLQRSGARLFDGLRSHERRQAWPSTARTTASPSPATSSAGAPYFTSLARDGAPVVPETPLSEHQQRDLRRVAAPQRQLLRERLGGCAPRRKLRSLLQSLRLQRSRSSARICASRERPNFSLDPVPGLERQRIDLGLGRSAQRSRRAGDDIRLFGQRIAFDGSLIGDNVALTSAGTLAEIPASR